MVKKKTRTWSNDEMRKAVEVIQESRLLYRKAADEYGISKSKLQDHVTRKVDIGKRSGPKTSVD